MDLTTVRDKLTGWDDVENRMLVNVQDGKIEVLLRVTGADHTLSVCLRTPVVNYVIPFSNVEPRRFDLDAQ
jgi:hypothetical protein